MKKKIFKWTKRVLLSLVALLFVLLIIGFTYEQMARSNISDQYKPTGELLDIGGRNLHYVKKGSGSPTVVFEAGLDAQGHLAFEGIRNGLTRNVTTITYDRAGILFSEEDTEPKSLSNMTNDLWNLLKKTNCPKPYILVGHSFAGITLRKFIRDHKEDIQGVVFVDVSHPDQMNRMPDQVKEMMKPPPSFLIKLMNNFGINRMFINKYDPDNASESTILANDLMHKSLVGMMDEMNSIEVLANEAAEINDFGDIPLIVITGTHPNRNDVLPIEELRDEMGEIWNQMQKDLLNLSTNSVHIVAPKSGHYVQSDQPDLVIKAIQDLMEPGPRK
jgi:pimeloyl-ACP methyl ester carboxylesterase